MYTVKYIPNQEPEYNPQPSLVNNNGSNQGKTVTPFNLAFKATRGARVSASNEDGSFKLVNTHPSNKFCRQSLREYILWLIELEKQY